MLGLRFCNIVFNADGPILVHTTFGDLLRALDTPENLTCPSNLVLSREGFVVANFPGGHVVAFTANGNRLRHEIHNDHIQVNKYLNFRAVSRIIINFVIELLSTS